MPWCLPTQGNAFCIKIVREKLGNSTNSRDNRGNIWDIACLCFINRSISHCAEIDSKKTNVANNEMVGFSLYDEVKAFFPSQIG